jgi:hypothetical protein
MHLLSYEEHTSWPGEAFFICTNSSRSLLILVIGTTGSFLLASSAACASRLACSAAFSSSVSSSGSPSFLLRSRLHHRQLRPRLSMPLSRLEHRHCTRTSCTFAAEV